jgi:hypothetical protein
MVLLTDRLRAIRTLRGLSDDEYVDLMACFVQSLPYQTPLGPGPPKFPIETVAEGTGDCDDKSLLLAALLSREGYNCSLFYFEPETHMAVGIAAEDGAGYRGTGYLFIESTRISLVGSASEYLSGSIRLTSEPVVIRMSSGDRTYHAWSDVAEILDTRCRAERRARILSAEKAEAGAAMGRLIASGRTQEYSAKAAEYRRITADYEETQKTADCIRHHLDDRTGLSLWLNEAADAGQEAPRESSANGSSLFSNRDQITTWVTM